MFGLGVCLHLPRAPRVALLVKAAHSGTEESAAEAEAPGTPTRDAETAEMPAALAGVVPVPVTAGGDEPKPTAKQVRRNLKPHGKGSTLKGEGGVVKSGTPGPGCKGTSP
jgi:hypothetical protein